MCDLDEIEKKLFNLFFTELSLYFSPIFILTFRVKQYNVCYLLIYSCKIVLVLSIKSDFIVF